MANTLITPTLIAKEALMQLENSMVMGGLVHQEYKKEFVKVGATVNVRKPVKFRSVSGAALSKQDVSESNTSIVIDSQEHVGWAFNSADLTLTIEEYSERYIKPATNALANKVDRKLCELYKDVPAVAGTAGTTPNTFALVSAAAQKLDEGGVPDDMRRLVLNPAARWSVAGLMTSLYNPGMIQESFRRGRIGEIAGFDTYGDQNIYSHVKGTAGTLTVNGANQTGSTLSISAGSAGTLKKGDSFYIADVYAVNPVSGASTGSLQQFTVTADVASGSTLSTSISPSIITSGAYQTVDSSPANGAVITLKANHVANLGFHKNAFALVMVPMVLPDGAAFKARETANNMSIRVVKDYDIDTDEEIIRLDILFGVKTIYPELACRLLG